MTDRDPPENWTTTEWARAFSVVEAGLAEPLGGVIREALEEGIEPDLLYRSILHYVHETFSEEWPGPVVNWSVLMAEAAVHSAAQAGGEASPEELRARLVAAFRDS